jgi:transcriptional regulator GlxA family with amidase domain
VTQRRIGILGYDGVQGLDLVGPAEAFSAVRTESHDASNGGTSESAYDIVIIGLTAKRFVTETGLTMQADTTVSRPLPLDTLLVPGGCTMRTADTAARTAAWIASRANGVRRVASICTGAFGLAETGLLDGRRVTTHWRFARELAQRFPKLRVEPDALFIKDGRFYTSAGITAGIDLALAQIEEDHGPTQALAVARELVVYLKRPGGQQQFSEPLEFQLKSVDRFADLTAWIAAHLKSDLTVEAMAARTFLGARQFSRVFKETYGVSPAAFVEELRLSEASRRLSSRRVSVESVADSVGYQSVDVFRRAFERRFGASPISYRTRFATRPQRQTRTVSGGRNK